MQITSLNGTSQTLEPTANNNTVAEAASTENGFAALLAALLAPAAESADSSTGEGAEAIEAAPESVEPTDSVAPQETDDAKDQAVDAAMVLAAAALPAATSQAATPSLDPVASTAVEATASANTASVVIEAPVVAAAPTSDDVAIESQAPLSPAQTGDSDAEVFVPINAASDVTPQSGKVQSVANYEVTPSPARATKKTSSQVTSTASDVPESLPQLPNTTSQAPVSVPTPAVAATAANVTTTAPASAEATSTVEVAAALAAPQGTAKSSAPFQQVGSVTSTADDDDVEVTPSDTPKAAFAKAIAAAGADDDVEPAPARPAPVLEKNTMILARNALNLQVRGSSARELLASARDPEPRTEKTVDAPAIAVLPTTDAAQRLTLRNTATNTHGATHNSETAVTTTLPTLGDDLVKHVTLNAEPGERTLTMRLLPKSLGEVQIEVKSTLHDVTVRIVSQDASVRETLEHHVAGLRESLAKDGRETRVEIGSQLMSNMGNGENSTWSQRQATQQDAQDRPRFVPQSLFSASAPETATAPMERRVAQHAGALNLFA